MGVIKQSTDEGGATGGPSAGAAAAAARARYVVGPSVSLHRPGMDVKPPSDFGLYDDWDAMEAVWAHGFGSLSADPREHPIDRKSVV